MMELGCFGDEYKQRKASSHLPLGDSSDRRKRRTDALRKVLTASFRSQKFVYFFMKNAKSCSHFPKM